jgi:amino acid adenylation domain-containing protein
MIRFYLRKTGGKEHQLIVRLYALWGDSFSCRLLFRELKQLYSHPDRKEPPGDLIEYRDFSKWQNDLLRDPDEEGIRYWADRCVGLRATVLPFGRRDAGAFSPVQRTIITFAAERLRRLRDHCSAIGVGPADLLLASFGTYLGRFAENDFVVGLIPFFRSYAELNGTVGLVNKTLPVPFRPRNQEALESEAARVARVSSEAIGWGDYFHTGGGQECSSEYFSCCFEYIDLSETQPVPEGDPVFRIGHFETGAQPYLLKLNCLDDGDSVEIALSYDRSRIVKAEADLLDVQLAALFRQLERGEELIATPDERETAMLDHFSCSSAFDLLEQTVVSVFERQVEDTPDHTAIVAGASRISYRELNRRANQLARYLIVESGVRRDEPVAIRLPRDEWVIVAMLGIMKAGGAYLPIEPDMPAERVESILSSSGCKIIIDNERLDSFRAAMEGPTGSPLYFEENPGLPVRADDLAYIIYTSGSTGAPKGVMIPHRAVTDYVSGIRAVSNIGDCSSFALVSGFSADLGYTVLYASLLMGGELTILPGVDMMADENIIPDEVDCIKITPSHWKAIRRRGRMWLPAKCLVFGGERLTTEILELIRENSPRCRVYNHYGPTETAIGKLLLPIEIPFRNQYISVGRPFGNTRVYVLDEALQLVPIGMTGEICVGGSGLARGYLNDSELTARKFIAHPFAEGERLYRTGDRGRWLADGTVEFLGRTDDQVKIRGYRVEPGEIENALQQHPAIDGAVVVCRSVAGEELQLVAYCYGRREELTLAALTGYLSAALPSYMIPAIFVVLDQLPLNANGKIDRGMLPDPEGIRLEGDAAFETPVTSTQRRLAAIWQHLLSVSGVGLNDHFFDLGGHSLKATRLASQIHKEFGVKIDLRDLFAQPVLRDQARLVTEGLRSVLEPIPEAPVQESYVLSSSQQRLWVMSQLEEGSRAYHMPAVYQFEGELDEEAWSRALTRVVERHEILRTVFEPDTDGQPRQRVLPMAECGIWLERRDLRDSPQKARGLVELLIEEPFDLTTGPLLRAGLYRTGQQRRVFCFVLHHLISDGWSMGILVRELLDFYQAYRQAVPDRLEDLRIQYKDYAVWQQGSIHSESLNSDKAYWLGQFADGVPEMEVSTRKRPAQFTYQGDSYPFTIGVNETAALLEMTRRNDGTLFMSLLFFVNLLLFQYTGKRRILVGTSIAGRDHIDLENQVGFYLNNVALITEVDAEDRLVDYYDRVKSTVTGALLHQRYPLELLIEEIDYKMDPSRPGLFNVLIELHNESGDLPQARFEDIVITEYTAGSRISHFDLIFDFQEVNGTLACSIVYCTDLFDKTEIHLMKDRFLRLVKDGVTGMLKNKRTGDVGFRAAEKEQQIAESHLKFDLEENF